MIDLMSPRLLAQTRVTYQWARLEQLDQWWHWALVALIFVFVFGYIWLWYRRDAAEQLRPVGWALTILRVAAFLGLLLYFFQFDKRTEQRVVRDSRVAVLVDTSLSMTLAGTPSSIGVASNVTRADEVSRLLGQSDFLKWLAQSHELTVYRFDQSARPVALAALPKNPSAKSLAIEEADRAPDLSQSRQLMIVASLIVVVGVFLYLFSLFSQIFNRGKSPAASWSLLIGSLLSLVGLGLVGRVMLSNTSYPLVSLFGSEQAALAEVLEAQPTKSVSDDATKLTLPTDWGQALQPSGVETRFGDVVKFVLDREAGAPLAGIVIFTDGRNNAGIDPKSVIAGAKNARVPLYIIGLGSDRSPSNLRLMEIDAPPRVYPGDRFTLSALVNASGYSGKTATVQVLSGPKGSDPATLAIENETQLFLPEDDSLVTARFELEPKTVGEWAYHVKVLPLDNEADARDNLAMTEIKTIERKNRVLVFAGGPTREYQFVRNLLYRDRDVESHVLLQSGTNTSSQESHKLLKEFPADRAALAQYDAILSFDADWTKVPDASVEAMEQWVAEQAGGLMLVAGSVEMPKWIARSSSGARSQILRSLSPVQLEQRGSRLLAAGRVESETAWPLTLTPDGQQTDFLWLNDDPQTSNRLWESFDGVFSYYAAYELKPGAKALALFSDPTAAIDGQKPVYIASQFYGAGRVIFQGGGEMWRIRELGDQYFDRYYTKAVRWVSQGRLLLDSDRGVLLVDREQALLGDQVQVRAVLKDERYQPLIQSEVIARFVDPQGRNLPLALKPMSDGSQPGVYTGQFPVLLAGEYSLQLQLGGIASTDVLATSVKARVPAIEMQRAERNDQLLSQMAVETGGQYWTGIESATTMVEVNPNSSELNEITNQPRPAVVAAILPQDQIAFLPGAPDRVFQLRWLGWLMALIAGSLTFEWFARRLHRLA